MDFSLLTTDSSFKLENYFPSIIDEFKMLGREIVITKKTNVISIRWNLLFLKTIQKCMMLHFKPKKSEDKNRSRYTTSFEVSNRTKAVITSILFMTRCFTLPDLYAGKMHALVFRTWNNRVKGRDWYDFEWYVKMELI